MANSEILKLNHHINLLRDEYLKIHNKYQELLVGSQSIKEDGLPTNFTRNILHFVATLFNSPSYSDISIEFSEGKVLHGHKFVLIARNDGSWCDKTLDLNHLKLTDIPHQIGFSIFKWVYTDNIEFENDVTTLLQLIKHSAKLNLPELKERCENFLIPLIDSHNCIEVYEKSIEYHAEHLKSYSLQILSNYWDEYTYRDFASIPAPLMYELIKLHSKYALHEAIKLQREDVVLLFLVDNDSRIPQILNQTDMSGEIPLNLALATGQKVLAETLIKYKADLNVLDPQGTPLLHKCIYRRDETSFIFLLERGGDPNVRNKSTRTTALHILSSLNGGSIECPTKANAASSIKANMENGHDTVLCNNNTELDDLIDFGFSTPVDDALSLKSKKGDCVTNCDTSKFGGHFENDTFAVESLIRALLDKGADVNAVDVNGKTALQLAIEGGDKAIFEILLNDRNLELPNTRDKDGHSPLWSALNSGRRKGGDFDFAEQLIAKGAPYTDVINPVNGIPLVNELLLAGNEKAAIFLMRKGNLNPECCDNDGTRPLHIIAIKDEIESCTVLLQVYGNDLNLAAKIKSSGQTAAHLCVGQESYLVLDLLLQHKKKRMLDSSLREHDLDLNVKDYMDQTALSLALAAKNYEVATKLIFAGADLNLVYGDGNTLLEKSILDKEESTAIYLLENGANFAPSNLTANAQLSNSLLSNCSHLMELAIKQGLMGVVKALCQLGANLNVDFGDEFICPLWLALSQSKFDIASLLVQYGCDTTFWCKGPENCEQTLLHKAIDENREDVACFLVRSNCEMDSARRPGPDGCGGEESRDKQTPLHLACAWGLEDLVACLLEHNADVNIQDFESKSPLHVAIENEHHNIISLLLSHPFINLTLKDKAGRSPFETAMNLKNHKAAQSILAREPSATEQVDPKGFNFLHVSIRNAKIEDVLFLLGIKANVNSRVQDFLQNTPLHLAMDSSEIIVRNLILAGSDVNAVNTNLQSALHLAVARGAVEYARILIENGADVECKDNNGNNALHLAVMNGHGECVKMLLTETDMSVETFNFRGRNALHLIGIHVKDNGALIFDIFHQSRPDLPLNAVDSEGHTALLHAYLNGRGNLCRAIVKAGASLGVANQEGVSIFNAQVASNQLLFRLLDMLTEEPAWTESDFCNECGTKFGITMRKHHCRHCGRVLCTKCSDKVIPINKFNLSKPVRVCSVCYEVLTSRDQV